MILPGRSRGTLRRYQLGLGLLLAPYLIGATLLVIIPALLVGPLAFSTYDGLTTPHWAGFANLVSLPANPLFTTALRNTLLYTSLLVPLRVLGALGLALLLRHPRRGITVYRTAVYLPTVMPGVAYALVWLWLLNPLYGPLNTLLAMAGLPGPAWLADPATALPALVLAGCFQLGESFVLLLAGLEQIPRSYNEAAILDGAGRWQQLRWITLPLLSPWIMLCTMRELIGSLQGSFAPALIMTGGGPYYATLFLPQLIYEESFERLRFGQGAAMVLVSLALLGLSLALLYRLGRGWGYDGAV